MSGGKELYSNSLRHDMRQVKDATAPPGTRQTHDYDSLAPSALLASLDLSADSTKRRTAASERTREHGLGCLRLRVGSSLPQSKPWVQVRRPPVVLEEIDLIMATLFSCGSTWRFIGLIASDQRVLAYT